LCWDARSNAIRCRPRKERYLIFRLFLSLVTESLLLHIKKEREREHEVQTDFEEELIGIK
jgi:hypothetical protein